MKVARFVMLLVGLLVPMTIASKSLDFNLNISLYSDLDDMDILETTESKHSIKTKSIIRKEVAESSQNIRCAVSKVDIISTFPPSSTAVDTFMEYGIDSEARYCKKSVNKHYKDALKSSISYIILSFLGFNTEQTTNYIRYL